MFSTAHEANGHTRAAFSAASMRPFARVHVAVAAACMVTFTCMHLLDVQKWILIEHAL